MSTEVNELIKTGVIFDRAIVRPAWFEWGGRRYLIQEVTQRWQTRTGQEPILHLGVTSGATCFELTFQQHSLIWRLAAVDTEHGP